jgi:hypothetical protein
MYLFRAKKVLTHLLFSVLDVKVAEREVGVEGEEEAHLVSAEGLVRVRDNAFSSDKFPALKVGILR